MVATQEREVVSEMNVLATPVRKENDSSLEKSDFASQLLHRERKFTSEMFWGVKKGIRFICLVAAVAKLPQTDDACATVSAPSRLHKFTIALLQV